MSVRAVLFDIDGTLIDSGGAGAESWKRAFSDLYDIPADIGKFTDSGMTDPEVGRRTFARVVGHEPSPAELADVLGRRLAHLPDTVAESAGYRVLPGVLELLPRLREEGYALGLTSGGTENAARIKLERGGLNEFFAFGGFGSDAEDRGELTRIAVRRAAAALGAAALARAEALVVGDTPHDIDAAEAACVGAVGVATGKFTTEQLAAAGADVVLRTLEEPLPL